MMTTLIDAISGAASMAAHCPVLSICKEKAERVVAPAIRLEQRHSCHSPEPDAHS